MSEPQLEGAEDAESQEQPQPDGDRPQLRLHHWFVLTAVMAVLLTINGPRQNPSGGVYEPPQLLYTLQLLLGISHTILSAVALTALGYGYAGYRRGERFFDEPGHWLLVELSLSTFLFMVPSAGYRLVAMLGPSHRSLQMATSFAISAYMLLFVVLGRMVINIYFGKTKCDERRWKVVFYMKAIGTVFFGLGAFLVIPAVLRASRTDRREHVARDTSHRYGVMLQVAESTLWLVSVATIAYMMIGAFRR